MRLLFCLMLLTGITNAAYAEQPICFGNLKEYEAVHEKLPALLQKLPVYVGGKYKGLITAAVGSIVFAVDGSARFYFNAIKDVPAPIDSQVQICATSSELVFKFPPPGSKNEVVKIVNANTVNVRNRLDIAVVSKAVFDTMSSAVGQRARSGKEGDVDSNSRVSQ